MKQNFITTPLYTVKFHLSIKICFFFKKFLGGTKKRPRRPFFGRLYGDFGVCRYGGKGVVDGGVEMLLAEVAYKAGFAQYGKRLGLHV